MLSVVVAVPDQRKGERLVLITSDNTATKQRFQAMARSTGASELMVPSEFMIVDRVPVLGSGKPDYVATTALVNDRLGISKAA